MATVIRPPIVTRIPAPDPGNRVPINSQSFVWGDNLDLLLQGTDNLPKSGRVWYYPNPPGPLQPLYGYTQGLPTTFRPVPTGPNTDQPNPRGYRQPIDVYGYTQGTPAAFRQPPTGPNTDQPNPRGYRQPTDVYGYTQGFPAPLRPAIPLRPNPDQPNPRGYRQPINIFTWINQRTIPIIRIVGIPSLCFSSDQQTVICTASDSPSGQNWSGAGFMAKYEIDTSIQIEGIFLDPLNNVYVDPTEVQLFILDPSGVIVDHTTLDGSIIRDEAGHYHFTFEVTQSGTWTYKWQGTGAALATSPDTTFTVNASALIGG